MLQRYNVCPDQLSAKLLFSTETGMVSLFAYGKTVLALANQEVDDISEEILLQSPAFTTIKYNSDNVITQVQP